MVVGVTAPWNQREMTKLKYSLLSVIYMLLLCLMTAGGAYRYAAHTEKYMSNMINILGSNLDMYQPGNINMSCNPYTARRDNSYIKPAHICRYAASLTPAGMYRSVLEGMRANENGDVCAIAKPNQVLPCSPNSARSQLEQKPKSSSFPQNQITAKICKINSKSADILRIGDIRVRNSDCKHEEDELFKEHLHNKAVISVRRYYSLMMKPQVAPPLWTLFSFVTTFLTS